ncbi:MAG: hypothetical protein K2P81_15995 [Bacteriovoracaceae bacterium]|nr:hypothetical protein [Bacteriovoracaceae bacterium]
MFKLLIAALFVSTSVFASAPGGAPAYPRPFWFFETTYSDGRIQTFPVQLDEYEVALPYNGRILKAEIPQLIVAKNTVGKNIKRRFTASRGSDVLEGEALCDLSKFHKEGTIAGESVLNFSGGIPESTPVKIRFYCQF